jgi:hypothetical protein
MLDVRRCMLLSSPFWLAAAAQGLAAQTTVSVSNVSQLRTAITTANGDANSYIIELASGTYLLTGAALDNANASGDLDIVKAAGTLEFRPAGASVIIDGSSLDRVFHVNNGANAPVTIEDITIRNGLATDNATVAGEGRGGGILKQGAGALTLQGVTLTANEARGAAGANGVAGGPTSNGGPGWSGDMARGGGLYCETGTIQLNACTISGNSATGGLGGMGGAGGIATVSNFGGDGGSGAPGGDAYGAGVFISSGTVTISLCTISQNTVAGGHGGDGGVGGAGGAGGQGGTAAYGGSARGGAIYVVGADVTIQSSTLDANAAIGGNAGDAGNGADGAVSGGAGGGNAFGGSAQGGAIFADFGLSTVAITASTISGNSASGGDGGLGGNGGDGLYGGNGTVAGIGGFGHGGGIYVSNADVTVTNSTLSANTANGGDGGAGGAGGDASFTAGIGGDGGPAGQTRGGGFFVRGGSIDIRNSTVADDAAISGTPGAGGAAGVGSGTQPAGNAGAADPGQGGGGYEDGIGGIVTATSTIFADNTGAIGPDVQGNITANNCLIENASGATIAGSGNVTGTDPALGALANNGGPTQTHAIGAGSAALNVGSNPASLTTDQRGAGFPRDDGSGVDIGAFEFDPTAPTLPPTVTNPAAPMSLDSPSFNIQGTAPANALVRIYSDFDNNGAVNGPDAMVAQQQLTGGSFNFSIATPLAQGVANNFTATAELSGIAESASVNVPTITDTGGGGTGGGNGGGGGGGCSTGEHRSWWGLVALLGPLFGAFRPKAKRINHGLRG